MTDVKNPQPLFQEAEASVDSATGVAFPPLDAPRVQQLIRWLSERQREVWDRARQNTEEDGAA